MAVEPKDLRLRLSGGVSNFDPNASLGGVMSNDEIQDSLLHNLFDLVTSTELSAGDTEYRCYYLINTHADDSIVGARVFVETVTPSADTIINIGLDPAGLSATATTIVNESTTPSGVSFSHPTTYATGLNIGVMGPGDYHAIWLQRIVSAAGTQAPWDQVVIQHGESP